MTSPTAARPVPGSRITKSSTAHVPGAKHPSAGEFTTSRPDERTTILTIHGVLDYVSVKHLEKAIVRAAASCDGIVLDLLDCNLCDSASLAALAKQKYVLKTRLQFVIGEGGAVRRAFEVTGLSVTLGMNPNVTTALEKLCSA